MEYLDENLVAELVKRRVVADTFRRLLPDKKRLIYKSAIRLFGKYGYDGLPVERICREAGISKGSFFQYFASKSHLLEFCLLVFNDRLACLFQMIREKDRGGLSRERLLFVYESFVSSDLSVEERLFYLFATSGLRHSGVVIEGFDLESYLRGYIGELVDRGVETGELRGDIEPGLTASFLTNCFNSYVARQFTLSEPERDTSEHIGRLLYDGLKR